jgi:hypothetical protein
VAALLLVPRPTGLLWENLFNAAHVVVSFVVALAGLRLSRRLLASRFRKPWPHYLVSLGLVGVIGGGVEVLQFFVPGTPSLGDLARDLLGGGALVLAALSFDRQTISAVDVSRFQRWSLRGAAVLCFGVSLVPMLATAAAAGHRWRIFPILARFDSVWDEHFVAVADGAFLSLETPPAGFANARGKRVARVVFTANGTYPKLDLVGPLGDWSTYRLLAFEVYSPATVPTSVVLRIHDRQHRFEEQDRFNSRLVIRPGENTISVRLESVSRAPVGRLMDMAAIASLAVFVSHPREPLTLYFDDFRLER